jgi:hypothetical protein
MTSKQTTTPEPPADAVAADAHWTATREKLRNRNRPTSVLTICDDPDVKKALDEARFVVRRVESDLKTDPGSQALTADLDTAKSDLETAQAAFDDIAIRLTFQALRRADFEDLQRRHPPTEEQADEGYAFNVEALGPELVAQSSLDGITVDDAKTYLSEWAEGEASALFNTAFSVQTNVRMDLGKG